jgi:hypothetical protein
MHVLQTIQYLLLSTQMLKIFGTAFNKKKNVSTNVYPIQAVDIYAYMCNVNTEFNTIIHICYLFKMFCQGIR